LYTHLAQVSNFGASYLKLFVAFLVKHDRLDRALVMALQLGMEDVARSAVIAYYSQYGKEADEQRYRALLQTTEHSNSQTDMTQNTNPDQTTSLDPLEIYLTLRGISLNTDSDQESL
jgi:hypothetical protein